MWTGDGRVFFYNPSTRTSLWERPPELANRPDVDKAIKTLPEALLTPQTPPAGSTNAEESSTPKKPPPQELAKQGKKRSDSESSNDSVELLVNATMTKKVKLNGEFL